MSWLELFSKRSVQKKTICLLGIEGADSLKSDFKLHDSCHGLLSKES